MPRLGGANKPPRLRLRRCAALGGRALCALVALGVALLVASPSTFAEKADKEKPINFSAEQPAEVDFEKRVGTLKGNVVITQGTLSIKADRIDFKQNSDNSISATAFGNPITFRQKKDDSDEYFEGFAQRAVYDGQKELLELFDRALLRQGTDEIRSNYISYNSSSGVFRAEGRPNAPGVAEGPGERVRGVFQPKSDSPLGTNLTKGGKAEPAAKNGKDKAGDAKDKSAAKSQSKDKAPVTLKPTDELKQ